MLSQEIELSAKSGTEERFNKTLHFVISLYPRDDKEASLVIDNLSFNRSFIPYEESDSVVMGSIFPFDISTKVPTQDLLENYPLAKEKIIKAIQRESKMSDYLGGYDRVVISLVGHSRPVDHEPPSFGVVRGDNIPDLLKEIMNTLGKNDYLKGVKDFSFRFYFCGMKKRIERLKMRIEDELKEFVDKKITIKSSEEAIYPNPFYQNIALKLNPKFNSQKGKYLEGRKVPVEHMLKEDELESLSHVRSRVFARRLPERFIEKKFRTKEDMLSLAKTVTEKKNNWTKMVFQGETGQREVVSRTL